MVKQYIPERGDVVLLDSGKRSALILSPREYNGKVGLALMCPITSKVKGYPFEVELSEKLKTGGVILSDHVKNLDWKSRNVKFIEKAPVAIYMEAVEKLKVLLD